MSDHEVRQALIRLLERGLDRLARLREVHGEHRDFDLVEAHQLRLIELVSDTRQPIPEERLS